MTTFVYHYYATHEYSYVEYGQRKDVMNCYDGIIELDNYTVNKNNYACIKDIIANDNEIDPDNRHQLKINSLSFLNSY